MSGGMDRAGCQSCVREGLEKCFCAAPPPTRKTRPAKRRLVRRGRGTKDALGDVLRIGDIVAWAGRWGGAGCLKFREVKWLDDGHAWVVPGWVPPERRARGEPQPRPRKMFSWKLVATR